MDTNSQVQTDECITQIEYSDFKENTVIQGYNGMNPPTTLDNSVPDNVYDIPLPPTTEHNSQLVLNESILEHDQTVQMDFAVTSQNIEVPQVIPVEQSEPEHVHESTAQNVEFHVETKDVDTTESTIIYENSANTSTSEASTEVIDATETSIIETTTDSQDISLGNKDLSNYMEVEESNNLSATTETASFENETVLEQSMEQVSHEHIEDIKEETVLSDDVQIDSKNTTIVSSDGHVQYTVLPPGENAVYQEDGTLVVEYPLHDEVQVNHEEVEVSQEAVNEVEISEITMHEEVEILEETQPNLVEVHQESQELTDPPLQIDESSTTETTEVTVKEEKPTPKPKGRRPANYIPLHIMGHDINKPVQDVPNGKPTLKPRLGVKIPYRNLASQIVSTTELQQQIVERARQKQEAQTHVDVSNSFAKKLTHRLAQSLSGIGKSSIQKKENTESKPKIDLQKSNTFSSIVDIAPLGLAEKNLSDPKSEENMSFSSEENTSSKNENIIEFMEEISDEAIELSQGNSEHSSVPEEQISTTQLDTSESVTEISEIVVISDSEKPDLKIESNSDLIAILEGDGDEGASIVAVPKPADLSDTSSEMKGIEKEVSLREQKNLQTAQPPKEKKFFKSRDSRIAEAAKVKNEASKQKENPLSRDRSVSDSKVSTAKNDASKPHSKPNDNPKSSSSKTTVVDARRNVQRDKDRDKARSERKNTGIVEVEPQLKPAMVLKTYTRKRKSNDTPMPEPPTKISIPEPIELEEPDTKNDFTLPIPPNAYVTKSSRVIKRKVIWDPDEAMPSPRNQSKILSKIEASAKTPSKGVPKAVPLKLSDTKSPTREKQPVEKKFTKAVIEEAEKPFIKKPDKIEVKTRSPIIVKSTTIIKPAIAKASPVQKISGSPGTSNESNATGKKSPKQRSTKRLTEIDKLLMDEGAVNMLYDINNSDDQKRRGSARISDKSTDKVQSQKELLNRTQEIKNELTQGTAVELASPKNLRKKEGPPTPKKDKDSKEMVRKMSKDSSKSSVHSPPPSPAAFTLADASRIIRRHSSSSFSTDDDLVHETLVDDEHEKVKEKHPKKMAPPAPETSASTSVEEATTTPEKPAKERVKKKAEETPDAPVRKKQKKEPVQEDDEEPRKPVEITIKSEPGIVTGELKTDPSKTFTLIKMNKHYMINLTYSGGDNYLTVQLLKDLTVTLKELGRNKNCNVVSVHSQGPSFCLGLDYKGLVESNEELRKKRASELSNCIRDFLKCLLNFPKVIVAGVKGECVGFGVTMLSLFDMIIASDSASFCTPYGKLGCAPEGGFLLSVPFQSNHGLASELLFTTQRMNADDAYKRGLVTKLFWPEKFDTEFRALLLHISNLSKAGLMATKRQLRLQHCQSAEQALTINSKVLIQLWTSEECQKNFVDYNALTFDNDQ